SQDVEQKLRELQNTIQQYRDNQDLHPFVQIERRHKSGRPQIIIPTEHLSHLLYLGLPVTTIANLMGVSCATLFRRMAENNLSVRGMYSPYTDAELDEHVSRIKETMPHAGYRLVKGALEAQRHRVQWDRVKASMHRVDSLGILSRMTRLGCIIRRTYSVPCPKYLVHIDTNHKLIRICADQGGENVGVARLMLTVRGPDSGSFIAGKSAQPGRLWRDLWMGVTKVFREGWDNHALRTEQNLTPNQLWEVGQLQNPIANPEVIHCGYVNNSDFGVNLPQLDCPLTLQQPEQLREYIDPLQPSESNGMDLFLNTVQYVES
ncbi:hypothetical protein AMEX_G7728, partial [Astyanax mexicanus]